MADSIQAPRASARCRPRAASNSTRLVLQSMRSSPATQASSSREVVSVCTRWPVAVSVFMDSAVRVLEWKGTNVAGPVKGVGRDVFMPASSLFFASRR